MPPVTPSVYPGRTVGIWGFVLACVGITLFLPVLLAGLILSIIGFSTSKKAGFKNTHAKAGIIISSILLVISVIFSSLLLPRVLDRLTTNTDAVKSLLGTPTSKTATGITEQVVTSCYNYSLPASYVGSTAQYSCASAANISTKADSLSAVNVSPLTTVITGDPVDVLTQALNKQGFQIKSVVPITVDGQSGAKATMLPADKSGLEQTYILVSAPSGNAWTQSGKALHSYSITAYTYNASLRSALQTVVDSIKFTAPAKDNTAA